MSDKNKAKRTSQYMDNLSFDETYDQNTFLPVEERGDVLVRKQNDPLDGYRISDIDDPYYGFLMADGNWYIMKIDSSGACRYAKGSSDYATNWGNRAVSVSYDYFNSIF